MHLNYAAMKKFPGPTALTVLTNFISVVCLFKVASSTLFRAYDLIFGNLGIAESEEVTNVTGCLKPCHFQKVHFPWRSKSFKLQVGALYLLPVGGVEQDQGGEGGVDLPNVNLGGRVWRNPWTVSWIFFYLCLGQL